MSKPPAIINPYIQKQEPPPKSNSTTELSLPAAENESACSGNLKSAGGSSLQPPSHAYFVGGGSHLKPFPTPAVLGSLTSKTGSGMITPSSFGTTTSIRMARNSKPTTAALKSATALFDQFQVERGEKTLSFLKSADFFDEINVDINDSKIADLLSCFGLFLQDQAIPNKRSKNKDIALGAASIVQYYKTIKAELKAKFRNAFPADESWYIELVESLTKHLQSRETSGENTSSSNKTQGIYREHCMLLDCNRDGLEGALDLQMVNACSLKSKNKGAFETALLLALNLNAAARGGEARHINWDEAIWDTHLATLEVLWKESKTLNKYPLVIFNDSKYLSVDFYFLLGGYFACDDGLHRNHASGVREFTKKSMYIFPSLQEHPPSYTTMKVTNSLREFVPQSIKHQVSSKSPRIGAITQLNLHPQMTAPLLLAQTGHSAGNTTDYCNVITTTSSLPGGKCLSGWPDIQSPVYPPTLSCFPSGSKEATLQDNLIDKLYIISLPDFLKGGRLCGLLVTCTATIIMYFREMDAKYKTGEALVPKNKVLQALVDADFFVSQGEALTGVLAWSDIVKKDFDASNVHQYVGSSRSSDTNLICTLLASNMELQAANLELRTMIAAGFFNVNQQFAALTASQNATRGDIQDVKDATSPPIDR